MKQVLRSGWAARCAVLACAFAACMPAAAAQAMHDALRVDDWTLSMRAMEVLRKAAVSQDPKASADAVAAAVVRDHLLGTHAHRLVDDARLFDDARVGFSLSASADATLVATLERAYGAALAPAMSVPNAHRGLRIQTHPLTRERLSALLGPGTALRLDDQLTPDQTAAMADVPLVDLRFDSGPRLRISLGDVWQQLDVTGRNLVYNRDVDFVNQQALRLARSAFVKHWAHSHGGLSSEDMDRLLQLMVERERRIAFERMMGAGGDPHQPSAELERLRREVSSDDIAAYWTQHPQQFQRIERVHARHIRCADEPCIQAASAALAAGEPFDAVARRLSKAASATNGGALGWIEPSAARDSWLLQFAFAQPPGKASPPVREPENGASPPGWQIVQVEERVTGVHPADSETVRFEASQAIARQRAAEQFRALRLRLMAQARVELSPELGVTADELRARWQR